MNRWLRARVFRGCSAPALLAMLLGLGGRARAFDYTPTPVLKALQAHDAILVAKVRDRAGDRATLEPVRTIKGQVEGPFTLPDTWRPGHEFTFGPVPLEKGNTYLLMLHRGGDGWTLSKDFAAPAVVRVGSEKAPPVRAVTVLYSLAQRPEPERRREVLDRAWDQERDATKRKLLDEFWQSPPDAATVPFLLRALRVAEPERSSLVGAAGEALVKHRYRESIPDLLDLLRKRDPGSGYAARALAAMKVRDAYEPIVALIEDPVLGNRPHYLEVLAQLEDPRAAPLFIGLLPRNLPALDPNYGTYRSWDLRENEAAAVGLGRLRAAEAVDPLGRLLTLEAPAYRKLRTLVVQALGEIGPPARRAAPAIRGLANRVDVDVAAAALQKIEGEVVR
jgi:hypothetical protein